MRPMNVSVPAEVISTQVEGEAVLLNLLTGQYYSLDEVGTRIWVLLAQHGQVEPVVQALMEEYDVAEDELRRDLLELADKLAAQGLLWVDEA